MLLYKFDVVCEIVKQARPLSASIVCDRKELAIDDKFVEQLADMWDRALAAIDDDRMQISVQDVR